MLHAMFVTFVEVMFSPVAPWLIPGSRAPALSPEHSLMTSRVRVSSAPGSAAGAGPHPGNKLLPGSLHRLQSPLYIRDTPHWTLRL